MTTDTAFINCCSPKPAAQPGGTTSHGLNFGHILQGFLQPAAAARKTTVPGLNLGHKNKGFQQPALATVLRTACRFGRQRRRTSQLCKITTGDV